jgi:NADPH:quinone reductase-like Zn-dependent oxidoreductase
MKAYELQAVGDLSGLKCVERPEPEVTAGKILVRVRACSLNFRDLIVMKGAYGKVSLPLVPLSDGAGEVVAVGAGVTSWKPGERVAGTFFQRWASGPITVDAMKTAQGGGSTPGMLAELVSLYEEGAVRIPDGMSFEEAATLPCAALTAWNGLVEQAGVKPGETVVLQGTGGVSLFGLQIAKLLGAKTILTSSSDEKLARAVTLGADATINYRREPDWDRKVLELTNGIGADHVLEVGGAGTFPKSLKAARVGGHIALIGVLSGVASELPVTDILMKSLRITGIYVGSRSMFESMNRAMAHHKLRPIIDRVFPFAEAKAAYEHLASGSHFGKVVIAVP